MAKNNDQYAVFGNPINHSKSPILQAAFAEQTQQAISYSARCIDVDKFNTAADQFFSTGGKGLNITVPFKLDAFNYADQLTARAKRAGAVNTLIKKDHYIMGDNTDGVGLINDIKNNLKWALSGKKTLVLGAGGAVRGILEPLLSAKPELVVIANRSVDKAEILAGSFCDLGNVSACSYPELSGCFDIIVNGTSASLDGKLPNLSRDILHSNSCCYDMMYANRDTIFMQWAKKNGATNTADGLGMLVCQGAESFYQWRGVYPETYEVIQKLRLQL
ncbi:shikimate dehydrogenase [Candidatus Endobugula sertula]|uniref:Shikimate dehydrogenase (NADP(+)) n=1 Tax=Candidatus Endobugula sertula TaxID=62101 RepID=A0A1D2QNL2_9GAMM|nr:shikimate dehydrogenase [Candidatus Endobugula sertula]